jgi:hypothetical protein
VTFSCKLAPKNKKPTFTSALATWASELFSIYALSSETCLARAMVGATRSVACARTTEHLATSTHRELEYDGYGRAVKSQYCHNIAKDLIGSIQIADS